MNLIASFVGADPCSYVLDDQWGYLDHALGSASIVGQVKKVSEYHVDADEPPVLDSFPGELTAPPSRMPRGPSIPDLRRKPGPVNRPGVPLSAQSSALTRAGTRRE
jgi:hypothetical protein